MSEPADTMESMAALALVLGKLPGVEEEQVNEDAADRMRKTVSMKLSDICDGVDQTEFYNMLKVGENKVLRDSEIDMEDLTEGQIRMRCQIAFIKSLLEEAE